MTKSPVSPSFSEFLRALETEAREAGFTIESVGPTSIAYAYRGVRGELLYEPVWREFVQAVPAERAAVVKYQVRHRALALQALAPESYSAAKPRLAPRLVGWDAGHPAEAGSPVALWPLVEGHLRVGFVIDAPTAARFVTTDDVEKWKVPYEELLSAAAENLVALTDARLVERFSGNPNVRFYQSMDGHDAARALVLHRFVQPWPPLGAVFVAPARDFLAFSPLRGGESLEVVHTLLERAQPVYSNEPGPISVNAFWFDGERFEVITGDYSPRGRGLVFSPRFERALAEAEGLKPAAP